MYYKRVRITLKGMVQGVGFRPFIHRIANSLELSGWVRNTNTGVEIEVVGNSENIDKFCHIIITTPPQYVMITESILQTYDDIYDPYGNLLKKFEIIESRDNNKYINTTLILPDMSICDRCYQELFEQGNRRYKYPFITCTCCGPRFTIIETVPYDRKHTSMKRFNMCSACKDEYLDISNIRYHAETIACDVCGPELCLYKGKEKVICNTSPVEETIKLIKAGYIIAVKGIGGFHIVCDATNTETVKKLRLRKRRQMSKPFAIMSNSVEKVKTYCNVNSQEEQLLTQPQRPIVLLQKKKGCKLITDEVAPDNKYLGVMLPYTPIHYLILDDDELLAIVATSGNVSGEPLIKDNDEAFDLLTDIADYLLIHNRDIYHRCDDSIVKNVNNHQVMIRRARGYVPMPVWINYPDRRLRCSLGVGAELKNTFCILKDNMGFISQHIGDMHNIDTLNFFKEEIEHFKQVLSANIEIIAHDMHPEYLTTRYALEFAKLYDIPHVSIQHHHAHVVSCMIEHGIVNEQVIGVVADGVGFGTDGNIWGFEFIIADLCSFKRYAHLRYVPMPGGDKATQEPWRMAVSYLYTVYDNNIPEMFVHRWGEYKVAGIIDMINKRINTPATSSCGRLFDAIASILNIKDTIEYDAQAAIELEMIADEYEHTGYRFDILENISETVIIDPTCVIADIVQDVYQDVKVPVISAKFHNAIIAVIVDVSKCMRRTYGINKVVLSGGVFQNSYILERIRGILEAEGFVPVLHSEIPPNDAGISLGQVIIANMNMRGMS